MQENIIEFLDKIKILDKNLSQYIDKEKGVMFFVNTVKPCIYYVLHFIFVISFNPHMPSQVEITTLILQIRKQRFHFSLSQ